MSFIANIEGYLTRDCSLLQKGDSIPVKLSSSLARRGWTGGTFVRWVDDGTGDPCVTLANGLFCAFLPFGSDEVGDRYTAMTRQNPTYRYATAYFGGNFMATTSYERYTYGSRNGPGPLVPLVYAPQQILYVSENGLITNEDESDPAVNPGGLFPDGSPILVPFLNFGICSLQPMDKNNNRLFVLTNGV
jgi:hypothetical protein